MSLWVVLAVNSITLGGLLFLLSAGFSLIFGLLRIPNLFFQAEDGIRDLTVTGVQTCALPILLIRQYLAGYSESQPTTAVTLHRTSYFGSAGDFWLEALAAALLMIVSLVLLVACAKDRKSVV